MAREHVNHKDIVQFAEDKVNLPKAKADEYRAQAKRVREKLENYLSEHPDFSLRKNYAFRKPRKGHFVKVIE